MKRTLLILAFVASVNAIFAQRDNNRSRRVVNQRAPSLSFGVQVSDPQGQFGYMYGGYPAGLAGQFLINSGRSPFEFGFAGAWHGMGSEKQDIDIYQGEDISGDAIWSEGTMRVSTNAYLYHGVMRLKPFTGNFQPYGDLMGGFRTFSTRTTIEEDNGGYTEVIEQHNDSRDFSISYGWAAGVKIRLSEFIMIEGRFENLQGGKTTYVDSDSIQIDDEGNLEYEELTSTSNVFNYQVGISIEF